VDIATITAALGSIKTATEIAKAVRESSKSLSEAETKLKLADLIGALADVKLGLAEVQEELVTKGARVRELELQLELRETLIFRDPCYWRTSGEIDEPFCQPCFDGKQKLSHLLEKTPGIFGCAVCGGSFIDKGTRQAQVEENARQAAAFRNRPRTRLV
jgi:hypothetical protein